MATSGLPRDVGAHLRHLGEQVPARVLLIRRTGPKPAPEQRTLLVGASAAHGGGWLERLMLDDVRDVLDIDFTPLADNMSVGGEPLTDPRYLVCTNGKHDVCCAEFGLPVARAVQRLVGARAWECSHVGGDRFAGNLVCLPDGLFYGQLDADTAATVVSAHEAGRISLPHWRGRSTLPFASQAVEALAREALGVDQLDGIRLLKRQKDGAVHRAELLGADGRRWQAHVRQGRDEHPRALTCAGTPAHAPTFTLLSLDEIS